MSKVISFFKSQKSSQEQFQLLVAPYMELMYGQAYKYTGSAHAAEDLLQDLLLELYQKQDKLAKVENPKAWLMRCLYNRFVDSYRKKKAQPGFDDIHDEQTSNRLAHRDCPETSYYHEQIVEGLELLSTEQRAVIGLHDLEGHTLAEISEALSMPVGTLKSHLHRGRKKLKEKLKLQPLEQPVRSWK